MDMIQHVTDSFLQSLHTICEFREGGISFQALEQNLWEALMQLGREILGVALEDHDQYLKEHPKERQGWNIQRGPEKKTIISKFGEVTYERRYYQHKETKERAYLVDAVAGIMPHQRLDATLQADLVAAAVNVPYALAGTQQEVPVTRQTVMNVLRKAASNAPAVKVEESPTKRSVETLYIEADEDHVSLQNTDRKGCRNSFQVPIIYVHEGASEENGHRGLQKTFYFTGLEDPEELWLNVWDYIDANYEKQAIKQIFIGGDGAAWIKTGLETIPKSIFVLDRFHLGKYLTAAISKNDQRSLYNQAWRAIDKGDRQKLNTVLDRAYQVGETDNRKQAVLKCQHYINNNWHGILPYIRYKDKVCPPSAEGHVSHVLSARLSSRPMAWCKEGVEYMAKLRVMQANGVNIQRSHSELFGQWQRGNLATSKEAIQSRRTLAVRFYERIQASLPALSGSRSSLTTALRSIAYPA